MAFYTQQSSDSEASYVMHTKLHTHKNVANLIKCSIRVFFPPIEVSVQHRNCWDQSTRFSSQL